MFCNQCGKEVLDTCIICSHCGSQVQKVLVSCSWQLLQQFVDRGASCGGGAMQSWIQ